MAHEAQQGNHQCGASACRIGDLVSIQNVLGTQSLSAPQQEERQCIAGESKAESQKGEVVHGTCTFRHIVMLVGV
jgi:hypothetical protein